MRYLYLFVLLLSALCFGACGNVCNNKTKVSRFLLDIIQDVAFDKELLLDFRMPDDEFLDEMMAKGVQGDLSDEEYEREMLRISLENRDVLEENIEKWETLTDSEKIDALMFDYMRQ